jgi:DNA-binding GntR family transcriptional regulator
MLTLTACSFVMNSRHATPAGEGLHSAAAKMDDLEEITTFIEFSQIVAHSKFAERLGLAPSTKVADLNAVMQIDECLNRLEASHASLMLDNAGLTNMNHGLSQQQFLFQLRYVNANVGTTLLDQRPVDCRKPARFVDNCPLGSHMLESCSTDQSSSVSASHH